MKETITLTITHPAGLHARPAALFVQTAARFRSDIAVTANGKTVNAKSMMGVLSLGASKGSQVEITADGEDASAALAALKALVESNFGET